MKVIRLRPTCMMLNHTLAPSMLRTIVILTLFMISAGCDLIGGGGDKSTDAPVGLLIWERALADELVIDFTQPVIDQGDIYTVAGGQLMSLSRLDGTVRWAINLHGTVSSRNIPHDDKALYLAQGGLIEAYSKTDGSLLWQASPDFSILIRHFLEQTDTHLYIGGSEGWVGRIRKVDGVFDQMVYMTDLKPEGDDHGVARIIVHENHLYIPTGHFVEDVPGIGGTLLVYERDSFGFLWGYEAKKRQIPVPDRPGEFFTTDVQMSDGVVSGDMLVIVGTTSILGFDRHTGEMKWEKFFENDDAFWRGITASNGVVYAGSLGAYVYAFDARSGEILWQSEKMDASIRTQVVYYEGNIYVNGGKLFVLNGQTGETLWSGHPPDYESSNRNSTYLSPVAVGEGVMVIVGTEKLYVHAAK